MEQIFCRTNKGGCGRAIAFIQAEIELTVGMGFTRTRTHPVKRTTTRAIHVDELTPEMTRSRISKGRRDNLRRVLEESCQAHREHGEQ